MINTIEDISNQIRAHLISDADLMSLLDNKLTLRYKELAGDEKLPYITFTIVESGFQEGPVNTGFLRFEIWTYGSSSKLSERIVGRLKQLFHKKIWTYESLVSARTFYSSSASMVTDNDKVHRNFVRFELRFYDLNLMYGLPVATN